MHTNERRVFVTGAAGFIGSHVCEALLERGARVIGFDNLDPFYDPGIKVRNLGEIAARANGDAERFRFVEGDLGDPGALAAAMRVTGESPTAVIHLAARAGVRPSLADPAAYARTNVQGTVNVFEAVRAIDPNIPIAMASSSSVYGNLPTSPFRETEDVNQPISPYAATKRACELLAHTWHHLYGTPIACLRFFTVFGPRQRPDLAIAQFIDRIAHGRTITLFGDGSSRRDYTYIDDIVAGVLASIDAIASHGCRIWNLGGSSPVSLNDMVRTVEEVVGRRALIERAPAQPGDVERTCADLTRSRAELGFSPRTPLAEGIARQFESYQRTCAVAR